MRAALPAQVTDAIERSAAPQAVEAFFDRLLAQRPERAELLLEDDPSHAVAGALIAVVAASNALARLCLTDRDALVVLGTLDRTAVIDATDAQSLARTKRLELLRIAARDLLGMDRLEEVGAALAALAATVLSGAYALSDPTAPLAVIGMGKLGASELNYASDVDVMFVSETADGEATARRLLEVARGCFRVDADLRPEGRAGPLVRSIGGYRSYWGRWASTWEFQALLKARPVAGDTALGDQFAAAARSAVWDRGYSADELAELRAMKARSESEVARRGLTGRELKRGPGGIRDVEFSVQLLQLVHGRHDIAIREPSTLGALAEMGVAGFVSRDDADALADSYRFLRTVEHRIQLVEEEQTHAVPRDEAAKQRLAKVLGFRDDSTSLAAARFEDELRRHQSKVRTIHERLFFRPLLEAFAVGGGGQDEPDVMAADAVDVRLAAFGFADAARTRAAVNELSSGLTRRSRLMGQMLPLLLDWLSLTPDPDLALIGLRNLAIRDHSQALMVATFRESPEAARRLCVLLGSSPVLGEAVTHNPAVIARLDDVALAPTTKEALVYEATDRMRRRPGVARQRAELVRFRQEQFVRIATRDVLDIDDVEATGVAMTTVAEGLIQSALDIVCPDMSVCVIGMGRLGGHEMAYASDFDVLLVWGGPEGGGEDVGEELLHFMHGPSPAQRIASLDLGLRPEGSQGPLIRTLESYGGYLARWAQTWERQALVRARVVAGDQDLGDRFMAVAAEFVWQRGLSDEEVSDIRRMKARIERERIPTRDDPAFHLKLGKGSLSDVEWTAQLLQLRHGVRSAGTLDALHELRRRGALAQDDAEALRDAYRFCEHTRNRWHLVGALPGGVSPGDALPAQGPKLSRLARSLATTPSALREDYRRVTRRARRVVERVFYGLDPPSGTD
jgi:[glutamine synthetase] adenylyltransferase / [glutamine synthetase]-adenylyl-L-tyrosine phosphorylase